jgi:hypothetical protein
MNYLGPAIHADIRRMLLSGESIRHIAATFSVSQGTIMRDRRALTISGDLVTAICACGRSAGHAGWCAHRLRRSPRRRSFLKNWGSSRLPGISRPRRTKLALLLAKSKPKEAASLPWIGIVPPSRDRLMGRR